MIIQGVLTWQTVKAKSQDSSYNILFMCKKKKNAYLKNLNILPELVLPSEKPRLSFRVYEDNVWAKNPYKQLKQHRGPNVMNKVKCKDYRTMITNT